jgi:hypothetical protein
MDINLKASFETFVEQATTLKKTIEQEKDDWEKQKEIIQKFDFEENAILELNVGGTPFTTFKSTIYQKINQQENYFTSTFSGRFDIPIDKQGKYFIDRDGTLFKYILSFLREGGSMKKVTFPQDKKVLFELKNEFEFYGLPWPYETPSSLISLEEFNVIDEWCNYKGKWKLIYQATKDGFEASSFHKICNHQGPTLCVIKSENGNIFGGFTALSWTSNGNYRHHIENFIFSLKTMEGNEAIRFKQTAPNGTTHSIYDNSGHLCTFGGGHVILFNLFVGYSHL